MKFRVGVVFAVTCVVVSLSGVVAAVLLNGTVSKDVRSKVEATFKAVIPDLTIDKVTESEVGGFYQLVAGTEVFYLSHNLQHMFYGSLLDLKRDQKSWNLTDNVRKTARSETISKLNTKDMVVFSPKGKAKTVINVFTDVDCIFCRRFHDNIDQVLAKGIEVRYLAFPRQGLDSNTYKTMESIWCADDKQKTMTTAKLGDDVTSKKCSGGKAVEDQFRMGAQLGVRGTPTLIFADGHMLSSYLEPDELAELAFAHAEVNNT